MSPPPGNLTLLSQQRESTSAGQNRVAKLNMRVRPKESCRGNAAEANQHGPALVCPSRLVSNLLKYWQVVDLRFSIIGLEDTAENNVLSTLPRPLHHLPPGRLPDEAGLCFVSLEVW